MKRFLLDSNALGHLVYRRAGVDLKALDEKGRGAVLGTALPVAAEILGGTMYGDSVEINLPRVERTISKLRLWPFDMNAVREYARLYSELRRVGVQMQVMDRMIAAIALTLPDCTLVSRDSDFSRVPGLKVVNWEA